MATRKWTDFFSVATFQGHVFFNAVTFLLPAIYATLSKLWVAQLDSSSVVTTDAYVYVGIFAEVVNGGLPRAAYLIIGDIKNRPRNQRIQLMSTVIVLQMFLGLIMSIVFVLGAPAFVSGFLPPEAQSQSIVYVRISAFSTLFSITEYAVALSTRSNNQPDVPLLISLVKILANIVMDIALISPVRVVRNPTVDTQAAIRLTCDGMGALAGLAYFAFTIRRHQSHGEETDIITKTTQQPLQRLDRNRPMIQPPFLVS
ncbi:hypothetical protein HK102_001774 [Quaeritorhiza haematococci]|nr:hypothetical protein HK102_001774 [Quaeritorhiza haematococci]